MKKQFLVRAIALVAIVLIAISSCKKDLKELNPKKEDEESLSIETECWVFPDTLIEVVGSEHNRITKTTIEEWIGNISAGLATAMETVAESNGYPNPTEEDWAYMDTHFTLEKIDSLFDAIIDTMPISQHDIFLARRTIFEDSLTGYESLANEIEDLKLDAEELECFDRAATLVALEVFKNSAYMWLPTENDGENYSEIFDPLGIRQYQARKWWRWIADVVVSDALGAFWGFSRAALPFFTSGGPANPVSNAVIAGATVIGAAQSSSSTAVASVPH